MTKRNPLRTDTERERDRVWRLKKRSENPEYFRQVNKRWRKKKLASNPNFFAKQKAAYRKTHKGRINELHAKWRKEHPGYMNAHRTATGGKYGWKREAAVAKRLYHNIQLKPQCEKCGKTEKLEGHHPDYNKPLEVMTLCKDCHEALHAELRQQGKGTIQATDPYKCEVCYKTIKSNNPYVRLNEDATKKVHLKCFAKILFPGAQTSEIKIMPIALNVQDKTEGKQ